MAHNLLLSARSAEFLSLTTEVRISAGQTLHEGETPVAHCLFLAGPLVSFMSCTAQGSCVAVGVVGNESVIGAAALLDAHLVPYHSVAQTSGSALKIPVPVLHEWLSHDLVLRSRIMTCVHALFTQIVQTAACGRFHGTEQRLARWLLLASDRLHLETLPFTQESLSQMVGTDRVSITRAAQRLKQQGVIQYNRGKTTILNRKKLVSSSCECYSVIKEAYDTLLALCSRQR